MKLVAPSSGLGRLETQRALFPFLGVAVILLTSCRGVPHGAPIDDPELKALLRPKESVAQEELIRGEDGKVYYSAILKETPNSRFSELYLDELEERGFLFTPSGESPHSPIRRIVGYTITVTQETRSKPYTVRYRLGWDGWDPDASLFWRFWDYPSPASTSGRRVVLRLGGDFLRPWQTAVLVPEEHQAALPFSLPLPPSAVVLAVREEHTHAPASGKWTTNPLPRSITVDFIARKPPEEVIAFYRQALSPWGTIDSGPSTLHHRFNSLPPWAPTSTDHFYLSEQNWLFTTTDGIRVATFRHASFESRTRAAGTNQPKSLRHLPEVYRYWAAVNLERQGSR